MSIHTQSCTRSVKVAQLLCLDEPLNSPQKTRLKPESLALISLLRLKCNRWDKASVD